MKRILYFTIIAISLFACKGEEGPVGPRGPAGPTGPQGPAGSGGTGAKTIQFEIQSQDWTEIGTQFSQGYGFGVELNVADITQSVYDYGAVLTYIRFGSNLYWESIPATFSLDGFEQTWNVFHDLSTVWVEVYDNDFNTVRPSENVYLKIVVIDGELGSKYSQPDIDLKNYEAVKAYYNLP